MFPDHNRLKTDDMKSDKFFIRETESNSIFDKFDTLEKALKAVRKFIQDDEDEVYDENGDIKQEQA